MPLGVTDMSPYITKIKYENPNLLLLNSNAGAALFAKQLPELGGLPNTTVMGMSYGVTTVNTVQYPAAVGWYSMATYVPGMTSPAISKMLALWTKVNGNANMFAPTCVNYVNLLVAIEAIKLAGSTDREAINNAGHSGKLVVDVPYGQPMAIKADGTNDSRPSVVKFLAGGQFQVVQNPVY